MIAPAGPGKLDELLADGIEFASLSAPLTLQLAAQHLTPSLSPLNSPFCDYRPCAFLNVLNV